MKRREFVSKVSAGLAGLSLLGGSALGQAFKQDGVKPIYEAEDFSLYPAFGIGAMLCGNVLTFNKPDEQERIFLPGCFGDIDGKTIPFIIYKDYEQSEICAQFPAKLFIKGDNLYISARVSGRTMMMLTNFQRISWAIINIRSAYAGLLLHPIKGCGDYAIVYKNAELIHLFPYND